MGVSARSALYVCVAVISLAISFAAPFQAVGGPPPAVRERSPQSEAGAPPSPALTQHAERFFVVPERIGPPPLETSSQPGGKITLSPPDEEDETLTPEEESDDERTVALTRTEYKQFKKLVKIGGATPLQIGAVTGMSVGVVVLIVGIAYIILLVILRYVFNRWFDADVYNNTWASVAVICTVILGGVILLAAAVLR